MMIDAEDEGGDMSPSPIRSFVTRIVTQYRVGVSGICQVQDVYLVKHSSILKG